MTEAQKADAFEEAELKIQRVLLDLWEKTGMEIDDVAVDTRQLANFKTRIHSFSLQPE